MHLITLYKKTTRFDIIKYIRFIYDIYKLLKTVRVVKTLLLLSLVAGVCVWSLFSNCVLDLLYSSASSLLRKRAGCFALMWCSYPCYVPLPHEDLGQSAVCDCKITWSYSLLERRRLLAIQVSSSLYEYMQMHEIKDNICIYYHFFSIKRVVRLIKLGSIYQIVFIHLFVHVFDIDCILAIKYDFSWILTWLSLFN